MHRRTWFRKQFDKETLNQGIMICRACHSGIHKRYDEKTLGKRLNTLALLLADESLQEHFNWVGKQRERV